MESCGVDWCVCIWQLSEWESGRKRRGVVEGHGVSKAGITCKDGIRKKILSEATCSLEAAVRKE